MEISTSNKGWLKLSKERYEIPVKSIIDVIDEIFDKSMNKIYYFGAEWCPQCNAIYPQFKHFCEIMNIEHEFIDAEGNDELVTKYNIRNLPTIIAVRNDEVVFRGVGFNGFKQFKTNYTNASV